MAKKYSYYSSKRYQKRLEKRSGARTLFCAQCGEDIVPIETTGKDIYPNRKDLHGLVMYKCPKCGNYGGEHATVIPTYTIRKYRQKIHSIIDPLWRSGIVSRAWVYREMSRGLGKDFHSGNIRSDSEAISAFMVARRLSVEVSIKGIEQQQKKGRKRK